jgi:hypothetical protein
VSVGTVYLPIFFPRWRVRFVFHAAWWEDGTSGWKLCEGLWHRTQEEAEKHAIYFLDKLGPDDGSAFYDFEVQR